MSAFPSDWGHEYAEAARIERHRRDAVPDPNTGRIEDEHWRDEPEDEEARELSE